jgi:hypothetical protein
VLWGGRQELPAGVTDELERIIRGVLEAKG